MIQAQLWLRVKHPIQMSSHSLQTPLGNIVSVTSCAISWILGIASGEKIFTVNQMVGTVGTPGKNNDELLSWTLKEPPTQHCQIVSALFFNHFLCNIEMYVFSKPFLPFSDSASTIVQINTSLIHEFHTHSNCMVDYVSEASYEYIILLSSN